MSVARGVYPKESAVNPLQRLKGEVERLLASTELSDREISRRTGDLVSHAQVGRLRKGLIGAPNWDQLEAIRYALLGGVSEGEPAVEEAGSEYRSRSEALLNELVEVATEIGHLTDVVGLLRRLARLAPEERGSVLAFLLARDVGS